MGPMVELEAWMWPKVRAWDHGVCTLAKISKAIPPVGIC